MNVHNRRLLLLALLLVPAAITAGAQTRLFATEWSAEQLLEIDPATGAHAVIGPFNRRFVGKLAWDSTNGVLYAASGDSTFHDLVTVDPDTGNTTLVGPFGVYFMQGLAYVPQTDTLYGVASGSVTRGLYTINRATGAATSVASISGFTGSVNIAYDTVANVMYLAQISGQNLRTLNLATGATTVIGPFNAPAMPFAQCGVGMAFDPALGLLATDNTGIPGNDNPLYRINTATGNATLIGLVEAGIAGMAFVPASCDPCDLDCNGSVNQFDIQPFIEVIVTHAGCSPCAGDIDGNGTANAFDINGFVDCLIP